MFKTPRISISQESKKKVLRWVWCQIKNAGASHLNRTRPKPKLVCKKMIRQYLTPQKLHHQKNFCKKK